MAAAYVVPPLVPPDCEATMVQVPTATVVIERAETVQIPVVLEDSVTVNPELAVAPEANVSATNLSAGWAKVMVCAVAELPAASTAIVKVAVELPPAFVAVTV